MHVVAFVMLREKNIHMRSPTRKKLRKLGIPTRNTCCRITEYMIRVSNGFITHKELKVRSRGSAAATESVSAD
jgi:hypothetical protein